MPVERSEGGVMGYRSNSPESVRHILETSSERLRRSAVIYP